MKVLFLAAITLTVAITPAFAGSKNVANSNSSSWSGSEATAQNQNINKNESRLQAPGLGSFGGGACPEGLMLSVPGGGIGFQVQCREYKQALKYGVVNGAFGREGTRRWLCESDKDLYTLPQCRAYRVENARRRR